MSKIAQGNREKMKAMREYLLQRMEKMKNQEDKVFFSTLLDVMEAMQLQIDALEREIGPNPAFIDLLGHDDIPHNLRG